MTHGNLQAQLAKPDPLPGASSSTLLTDGTGDADRSCSGDPTDRQPDDGF